MRTSGWHGRLAMTLAAATTLAVAAPAGAATTVSVEGGTTTLTVSAAASRALGRAGISLAVARPARVRGGRVTLPISGGTIDPATARGTIAHRGALVLRMGRARVQLASPTINTARGTFSARIGRRTVVLGSARDGRVVRDGFDTRLRGVRLAVSRRGAAALGRALGVGSLRALTLGRATVAPETAGVALQSGATTLAFTPTALGAFGQLGVAVTPIAPAGADGATGALRFPVTGGTLDPDTFAGTVEHGGGISLQPQGSEGVQLADLVLTFGGSSTLTVNLGTIADLDLSGATRSVDADARTVSLAGARVRLNQFAATALNALFGASAFPAGAEIATLSLTAQAR